MSSAGVWWAAACAGGSHVRSGGGVCYAKIPKAPMDMMSAALLPLWVKRKYLQHVKIAWLSRRRNWRSSAPWRAWALKK